MLVFQVIIDKVIYTLVRKLYERSRDEAYDMIFMTVPEESTVRTVSMLLKTIFQKSPDRSLHLVCIRLSKLGA